MLFNGCIKGNKGDWFFVCHCWVEIVRCVFQYCLKMV